MYELKKIERNLRVNLLGPGPRRIKKNYRVAVSQRLRNTGLQGVEADTTYCEAQTLDCFFRSINSDSKQRTTSISGPPITIKITVSTLTVKCVFRQKHAIKLRKRAINKMALLMRK